MPDTAVTRTERTFVDDGGVTNHYWVWPAAKPRAVVHIVHGIGEYALRYEPLAQALAAAGYTVYAGDYRGHGSTGVHQYDGDLSHLGRPGPGGMRAIIRGVSQLRDIAHDENPDLPIVLLGHSMGSLLGQRRLNEAVEYDAVIFSGTAYRTLAHMNSGDLAKRHRQPGGTGHEWLSRDVAVQEAFRDDPLTFDAKVAKLFGIPDGLRLLGRPRRAARDIPMLIVIGSDDPLGGPRSVGLLAEAYRTRGGLSDVTVKVYEGARHELFNETNQEEVRRDVIAWLDSHVGR
ncbi:MAG: alpha/beta hydrolase [Microbacteriaceae bacterium]|nr:alpha/beta hydrolase [Microbacteriaceae bacterium]